MEIWYALFAAFAVMSVSLIGVIFTAGTLGNWMQRYLTYLATFSGGVFLLIAYSLAEEAVHEGGWIVGVGSVVLGAALMEAIHYFFPLDHHHHEHVEEHTHSRIDGRRLLLSDALHNIGDGILLVGAFSADIWIGIAATVGVILHEMVQEISEYFVLRESGLTSGEALTRNFLVSSTIFIGFIFAALMSGPFVAILSGLAAGGFLSVVLHDLLPHAIASVRTHGHGYAHLASALVGAASIFTLQRVLPHEEAHVEVEADEPANTVIMTTSAIELAPRNPAPAQPTAAATDSNTAPSPSGAAATAGAADTAGEPVPADASGISNPETTSPEPLQVGTEGTRN